MNYCWKHSKTKYESKNSKLVTGQITGNDKTECVNMTHTAGPQTNTIPKITNDKQLVTQSINTQIKINLERISGKKDINNDQSNDDNNQSIATTRSREN